MQRRLFGSIATRALPPGRATAWEWMDHRPARRHRATRCVLSRRRTRRFVLVPAAVRDESSTRHDPGGVPWPSSPVHAVTRRC